MSEKKKAKPGPRKLAKSFAAGNWIPMLAKKHEMFEVTVEAKLMEFCRQSFKIEKNRKLRR